MLFLVGVQLIVPWIIRSLINTVTDENLTLDALGTITRLAVIVLVLYLFRAILHFFRSYGTYRRMGCCRRSA